MLKDIDINKLAEKIRKTYREYRDDSSISKAKGFMSRVDERLEPVILAWIEEREIPDVVYENCSMHQILAYRPDIDFMYAMEIFSMYIQEYENPEEAELLLNYRLRRKCVWFKK